MPNYYRMNKILEEEGTMKRSEEEATSYAEHEAYEFIKKEENKSEANAEWQWEYYN